MDDRAEPSQAGSVSSARYCSARLGSVFSWNTEPSLIIIISKLFLLLLLLNYDFDEIYIFIFGIWS